MMTSQFIKLTANQKKLYFKLYKILPSGAYTTKIFYIVRYKSAEDFIRLIEGMKMHVQEFKGLVLRTIIGQDAFDALLDIIKEESGAPGAQKEALQVDRTLHS